MSLSLARRDNGAWQDSSGATATLTQQLIRSLLGLDYQTFINSAFLLQGRADEFARQSASDRKEILGDILGLDIFERLSREARERAKQERTKADLLEVEIERLNVEVSREPELQRRAEGAKEKLVEARDRASEIKKELEAQQTVLRSLEEKERRARELEQGLAQTAKRVETLQKERNEAGRKIEECETLLGREKKIEEGFAALTKTRREEAKWGEKAARFAELSRQRETHSLAIERERAHLQSKVKSLKEQAEVLAAKSKDEEIRRTIETCKHEITSLESRLQETAAVQQSLRAQRDNMARLAEKSRQLESLLEEKKESLGLLQQAEAACPVCRVQLSEERRLELIEELKKEQKETSAQLEGCKKEIAKAKSATEEQEDRLREMEKERTRFVELKHTLGKSENMLTQAQAAKEQLRTAQNELAEIEETLRREKFAAEARGALSGMEAQITALGYDAASHRKASEQARTLLSFEAEKTSLNEARATAAAYQRTLEKTTADLGNARLESRGIQEEIERIRDELAALPDVRKKSADLSDKAETAEREVGELDKQAAILKNEIERLDESRRSLARRQKERETALEQSVVHTDLAAAFGKNGVQALIIETALPQLEQHANELLGRLTEGRMGVSFYTQKEKQSSGEMAETLEIRIRDQSGERRYEMYSGGEAFRLNFAIRLALSRFLTQRAGARLSTLVIDEGFGSQDVEGRQRLVEAIRAVSEDFERIVVITHLDELKAEFPHRIEVSKDETGSHVHQVGIGV